MRSVTVPSHEHKTFDIKPLGECRACDNYHERVGVTGEQIEAALPTTKGIAGLRLLAMMYRVDPDRHTQIVEWMEEGMALSEAVDEIFGENVD
jgi:hypothetical protein